MGGGIAAKYCTYYEEKVISLALVDTNGFPKEDKVLDSDGKNPVLIESFEEYDALLKFMFEKQLFIPGNIKTDQRYFFHRLHGASVIKKTFFGPLQ